MANGSIGTVNLDLNLNQSAYDRQINNISNTTQSKLGSAFKKVGGVIAGALAIGALVKFSGECIKLGSNLQEVQNVVDVTFNTMSKQVDAAAQNSIKSLGMSQTAYKKTISTSGAMAKAFGFSEQAAFDMGTGVTNMVGDVASFYNLSHDEAFTKMKSIFTGETESLKELGVVMTQAALDEYALKTGVKGTTQSMTEQEKVALRYSFVMDKLKLASGDFVRTQGGWANQTRILNQQWEQIKATIGMGLINALTPLIQVLNTLIAKVQVLANGFLKLTQGMFGNAGGDGSGPAAGLSDIATIADTASSNVAGIGASAKATGKAIAKTVAGFDQLTKIGAGADAGAGGGAGAVGGIKPIASAGAKPAKTEDKGPSNITKVLDIAINKAKELANLFKKGFVIGLDGANLNNIIKSIKNIGKSLLDIFTDKGVLGAVNTFVNIIAETLGKIVGSIASIGITIGENLLGGLEQYLAKNSEWLKTKIISMFDIVGAIYGLIGDAVVLFADIFSVFKGDEAKGVTANIIDILVTPFIEGYILVGKAVRDIFANVIRIFSENKEGLKTALTNLLGIVNNVLGLISTAVHDTWAKMQEVYDTYIGPALTKIGDGFSSLFAGILNLYNTYLAPFLARVVEGLTSLYNEHLKPLVDKVLEFVGKLAEAISVIWTNVFVPFINWFMANILPILIPIIENLWNTIKTVAGNIMDAIGGVITVLSGMLEFIIGVFTGDWTRAWEGIKTIYLGQWEIIKNSVLAIWNFIVGGINGFILQIKTGIQTAWEYIKLITGTIWVGVADAITGVTTAIWTGIGTWIDNIKTKMVTGFTAAKDGIVGVFSGIKDILSGIFFGLVDVIKAPLNAIIDAVNVVIEGLNGLNIDVPDWVPGDLGGKSFGVDISKVPKLAQGGYLPANQPRLAIVGDNKTQGEIVTPENKMAEVFGQALDKYFKNSNTNQATSGGDITIPIYLAIDGKVFYSDIKKISAAEARRQGTKQMK